MLRRCHLQDHLAAHMAAIYLAVRLAAGQDGAGR